MKVEVEEWVKLRVYREEEESERKGRDKCKVKSCFAFVVGRVILKNSLCFFTLKDF